MGIRRDNRNLGQTRTIEVFLAVVILFSALTVAVRIQPTLRLSAEGGSDLESIGANLLLQLNNNGTLVRMIDERNWTAVNAALTYSVPAGLAYNFTVYTDNRRPLNNVTISNGGLLEAHIVSLEFLTASTGPSYQGYIIRLQLSRAW